MPDDANDALTMLKNVLASAATIADDLGSDPLLARPVDVFARMPPEDREPIVKVLEREVDLRLLGKEAPTASLSGLSLTKPNPSARLYFRVTDTEVPYVAPEEIMQAVTRATRVLKRASERGTDLQTVWLPAMIAGLRMVDPSERETLRWYHRTILALLDEAEREP
jgi:hypothetical protein